MDILYSTPSAPAASAFERSSLVRLLAGLLLLPVAIRAGVIQGVVLESRVRTASGAHRCAAGTRPMPDGCRPSHASDPRWFRRTFRLSVRTHRTLPAESSARRLRARRLWPAPAHRARH